MRVLVLVKATADSEKGFTPTPWGTAMMAAMGRFNDELRRAGVLLMPRASHPPPRASASPAAALTAR